MKKRIVAIVVTAILVVGGYSFANFSLKKNGGNVMKNEMKEVVKTEYLHVNTITQKEIQTYAGYIEKAENIFSIPIHYELTSIQEKQRNKEIVVLLRYSPSTKGEIIGGEHYSIIIRKDTLDPLGFVYMDRSLITEDISELPSALDVERITKTFLDEIDLSYFEKLEHQWTAQHDETMLFENKMYTIPGMKYKTYVPSQDDYTWVVIGRNHEVIAFEIEMLWDNGPATEQWFRDDFLKEN